MTDRDNTRRGADGAAAGEPKGPRSYITGRPFKRTLWWLRSRSSQRRRAGAASPI
jgi:hypothetical protein